MFLFYVLNYPVLRIRLTPAALELRFGVFRWRVPLENVADCRLDAGLALLQRCGGAGIHFIFVRGRYRASFNFLEHPRLVIAFKHPRGPVRDLSFSTGKPEELLGLVRERAGLDRAE